jgi:putative acetyltransferase
MPANNKVTIAIESPLQDDVRGLVAELNETLLARTPREFCHHLTVEQMAGADTTVWIARDGGKAVGCGALKRHGGGIGEVKRMYTQLAYRGQGLGGRIAALIEDQARADGLSRLVLETGEGDGYRAAWRVYERADFKRCGVVLDYPDTKWSVFYEKALAEREQSAA